MRAVLRWTVLWVGLGLCLSLAERWLWDTIWVLTLGVWIAYAIVGLALFSIVAWRNTRVPRKSGQLARGIGIVVAGAVLVFLAHGPLARSGDTLLFRARFSEARAGLEAALREESLAAGRTDALVVDSGPPLRLAWRLPGGITDNWEAVVYDPTGAVASARGITSAGSFTAAGDIVNIFGGALVECQPVARPYYRCWFT
jgi:hypothetical protein